jgi:hypothetical protein
MIRRWKEESGSRSSRAPAFTGTAGSLLPREHGQAARRQGFCGQTAVLVERVLLRRQEKFLAVPRGVGIKTQDALDDGIDVGCEITHRADVRDEADLPRLLRGDGIAEEEQRKREARQRVFAEISHDRSWRKAEMHLGESQSRTFGDKDEIANDRQAETEAERVPLHLRDADQRRDSQGALEFDEACGFVMDRRGVPPRALASRTENFPARPQTQDPRAGTRCFAAKLGQHRIEHRTSNFVFVLGIVQREVQDIAAPLNRHPDRGIRAGKLSWFR